VTYLSVLSNYYSARGATTPKRLFATKFESPIAVTGPVRADGTHINYGYAGFDLAAVQTYFGSQVVDITSPCVPAASVADLAAWNALCSINIQATTLSADPNARELYLLQTARNAKNSQQLPLVMTRYRNDWGNGSGPNITKLAELPSLYWKFDCILDADLVNLAAGDLRYDTISELKWGDQLNAYPSGYHTPNVGSFRLTSIIRKNAGGQLYIMTSTDNGGNAVGIYPPGANAYSDFCWCPFTTSKRQLNVGDIVKGFESGAIATVGWINLITATWATNGKGGLVLLNQTAPFKDGEILQVQVGGVWTETVTVPNFWNGLESVNLFNNEQKYNYSVAAVNAVPLGTPVRFEYLVIPPIGGRKDLVTGKIQVVMTDLVTQARTVLANFQGGIMTGALAGDVITRLFLTNEYTTYDLDAYTSGNQTVGIGRNISNIEVWENAPYILV